MRLVLCKAMLWRVMQDFAVEPDEQRMRKAAHLMVGSLAGSLALVTCRDPLRTSLTNRLRSLLAQGLDAAMLEQYVQVPAAPALQADMRPRKASNGVFLSVVPVLCCLVIVQLQLCS